MLATAKRHYDEDIRRAGILCDHAARLLQQLLAEQGVDALCGDILRASWMMAVGALDAYFSDAYTDLVSRLLRAKQLEPAISISDRMLNLRVPVIAVIRPAADGWRWRMAARELMEDENVLSLSKIRSFFNQFFDLPNKLLTDSTIEAWLLHPDAKKRQWGITDAVYSALPEGKARADARKLALSAFEDRFATIFQRRHDCIHNCDRPRVRPQPITTGATRKTIADVDFLVQRCHEALIAHSPTYLSTLRFSNATVNQVLI